VSALDAAGYEDHHLDDMVHDAASRIGSAVNNSGMCEQLIFLLENGWTPDEIKKVLL
jgi:hypothetical protein